MRIVSIITAIVVMASLYFLVLQRDAVLAFSGRAPNPVGAEALADETAADPAGAMDQAKEEARANAVRVIAQHSVQQPIGDAVLLRGQTEAARQVNVLAETTGTVISDPLRKGSFVEAGQLICKIDPGTRQATLDQAIASLNDAQAQLPTVAARVSEAEARLREAEINYNAATKLREGGYASETREASAAAAVSSARAAVQSAKSGLDSAQAGISAARAAKAAAEKEIERLTVTAPFAGLLETDSAELGALLQPGALCATIIQLDPIKLVGFVPETEIDKLQTGAEAGARLASGRQLQGEVSFLGRSADPLTRTFRVEVTIPNPDLSIRDGQTVEMVVTSGTATAHLLPGSVLTLNDEGTLGVRIVDENSTAQFTPVRVLRDTQDGIWLTGLPDEADVIVIGQEFVTDGVPVLPSFEDAAQ